MTTREVFFLAIADTQCRNEINFDVDHPSSPANGENQPSGGVKDEEGEKEGGKTIESATNHHQSSSSSSRLIGETRRQLQLRAHVLLVNKSLQRFRDVNV